MSGVGGMGARPDDVPSFGRSHNVNEVSLAVEAQHATQMSRLRRSFLPSVKRWLREPLIHFLLLGAILFAVDRYVPPARGSGPSSQQIQLSLDDLAQLVLQFQAQWRREPTPEELTRLIENKVQNEVLYREALAM